jgi:hypothetical protein
MTITIIIIIAIIVIYFGCAIKNAELIHPDYDFDEPYIDFSGVKNVQTMSDKFYMSVTISNKEEQIIRKALTMLKNDVISQPKKHWEISQGEIDDVLSLLDDKKKWGVPYSIKNKTTNQ